MICALQNALDLWNQPNELINMWAGSNDKLAEEQTVKKFIGPIVPGDLLDLGCGVGRYSKVLDYQTYHGFDQSAAMIEAAKQNQIPNANLAVVDIFNYSHSVVYDLAILIDVAIHQNEPLKAVERIMRLWQAKRYIFSLVIGPEHEDLYSTTVVGAIEFLTGLSSLGRVRQALYQPVKGEQFVWGLFDSEGL